MVFEKFVVQLLDRYLSDYIDNLDYKKLNIDMWSGNVELENLSLKSNALADLNLPVIIKTGYLQKLKLKIPWKNLYTHPTKLTIAGLYIVVIPKIEVEYDAKQDEKEQHRAKMKEVDQIENLQKDKEELENPNQIEETNDTFSARMKLQIIQNLELSIHNIHIVYEDKTTKPNHPFAFGITLNSITFQTTNTEWTPTVMKENTPVNYKLGELNALSLYWNSDIKSSSNEIIKTLKSKIAVDNKETPQDMSYIFQPFNVKVKLIMTLKPRQQNFEKSMFHITIDLEHISLNLTRSQYLDILDLLEYQDHMTAKLKYIKYRPNKFENTIEKWKFAYNAIVNERIKPHLESYKWKNIKIHSNNCKEYRSIYFQELIGKITNTQKQRCEELEKTLDVFNLIYSRRRAQIEIKKKKQQEQKQKASKNVSKFWNKKKDPIDPELDLEKIMSDEEKKKFYETIGYEGEDTSTLTYPKEYVDIDLTIRLMILDLNIWSKINENDREFKVICQANLPNTELNFRRRPATSSAVFTASLGSFQVFGMSDQPNATHPILIQTITLNQLKLLEIEFTINPIDKDSGYRLQMISQSLEIKYHMPTINKLIQCFQNNSQHNLQGVKQVAYTKYTDVKNRSMLLMKHNVKKVQVLDIYIDLQSSYILIPENGIYYDGCPVLCMDIGHIVLQQNKNEIIDNYTQFQLELKNFQLLYANKNENWQIARQEENSRLHLIKPITLYTNILKCIYTDQNHLSPWKISGKIPGINIQVSDMRLFQIIQHLKSFTFPQSKITDENTTESWITTTTTTTQETFETIESLTEEIENKSNDFIQIEANFELSKIDFLLEEEKDEKIYPFLRISFISMCAQLFLKTFNTEFQLSLDDLIIFHEQFITKTNNHLCLLAAQHDENETQPKKLVTIHVLQTSSDNPLFTSSKYNELENKIRIHLSKMLLTLQFEALLSIMRFQDRIMQKLSNEQVILDNREEENKTMLNLEKNVNKNNLSSPTTLKIEVDLEEFRVVIGTIDTQMFDVYVQGVKADMHRTFNETIVNLILTDFCLLDPNKDARYHKIISQQTTGNDLLSISVSLFNYPKKYTKTSNDVDCNVKIHSAKANIILIYKHIDQLMEFLDTLNISKAAFELASSQADIVYEQVQKLQDQAFKLRLNVTFNAPNIIIPLNSTSEEALFVDLGKLMLNTKFLDDPEKLLIEQQEVIIENVLASRIRVNEKNDIQSEIILLECAKLQMNINRLLHHEKLTNKAYISIKMHWDLVHFRLANDDYLCMMKILKENFGDETRTNVIREQYLYKQQHQKQEEDALRNAVIQKQKELQIAEVFDKIRIRAGIKKLALTLYLGQSNLIDRRVQHEENSKLANVEIEILEIVFRQASNLSYKVVIRVKNFLSDDLRETHRADSVTRVMNRHHTVDPNAYMLLASLKYTPKDQTNNIAQQELNMELESLYICLKLDYLMIVKDFFMPNLPIDSKDQVSELDNSLEPVTTNSDIDIETRIDILVKNPEIILLENQHNSNSNCLVLNVALKMRMFTIGNDTEIFGEMNDLTIYSSNFAELKSSKIKYLILQPAKINLILLMNSEGEKIDIQMSNIIVNIAPAAVRILIAVANSFGKDQSNIKEEKFDIQTIFNHKPLTEANFWFLKEEEEYVHIQSKKQKETIQTNLVQEFVLKLTTIEIKLDLDFDSRTKSVVAMCLSNWIVNLKNWSNQMTLQSNVDIEAALYNEHTLAWEPFIEPVLDRKGSDLLPWNITCLIEPILPVTDLVPFERKNEQQKAVIGLDAKQLISFRTEQYLNITITKTGFDLIKNLSSLFNDAYNQRLPEYLENTNKPMLSLVNLTGKSIFINNLHGLEFTNNPLWTSTVVNQIESISLTAFAERSSSAYRLSVMEEQTSKNREEFSITIDNITKLISINRTWQRIYNLKSYPPIEILCDTQIHQNQRRVILSSVVKIFNNTMFPMIILELDSVADQSYHRIPSNEEFYIPINILYQNPNSSIVMGIDDNYQNGAVGDMFSFDWKTEKNQEENLQLKNGQSVHLIIYKEMKKAYSENTDQLDRTSYCIYIHSALQLINMLPINIKCSINNIQQVTLEPGQVRLITSGNKNSLLQFIIPSYDDMLWTSEPIDLGIKQKNNTNERVVNFYHAEKTLRLVLHKEISHESYHLSLYTPFWIVNHTNLKLEFRIGNERMIIENADRTYFICPEKYQNNTNEKGQIRLCNVTKDDLTVNWSEKFSLDVIKSIGMASCKGPNNKTYMICVDITTSSFGFTKILTLSPAMVVINQTTIPLEIVETVLGKEQDRWLMIDCGDIIPFWPQNTKDSLMYVRYAHNQKTSNAFLMNKKHQTLLYMNDTERLVIFVEVIATDFDGVRMIFSDYKAGDAPILLVNHTKDQLISFVQKDEKEVQYLVSEHFAYYTWIDPLKPREIIVACNGTPKTIELYPHRGVLDMNVQDGRINYVVFIDGVQTVLLFTDNEQIIEMTVNIPSSMNSICRRLQIGIPDVGLSIVNDITREELMYISLNKSKVQWVEMRKSRWKPFSIDIQTRLEEIFKTNPNNETKYQIKQYHEVTFHGHTAELITQKGKHKIAKRQSLHGLWIEYTWSMTNAAIYARINRAQIDNQLHCTNFPSMFYPVLPKITSSDAEEKSFIELSIYETKTAQSNIMHIQYCKILIQEFALRIDQDLILAILAFFREEKNSMTSIIDMTTDLEHIHKSLQATIKTQIDFPTGETQMFFDNIHLSPLKIHVSFSIHGSKSKEKLFSEYPLVGFLLKTLNVAEVQDVILRLGFYERSFNRFTITKLKNEVLAHYQNQFLKQIHVLILGLDVLGNPLGIVRGLAEGVESLFYEPYKGAIEGPIEFAEGVATGVLTLVGSTVGTAAGAISKITGVIGQSLATLTFDDEYQTARIRQREPTKNVVTDIATGGKNVVMGFFNGITGIVRKPIEGAIHRGASGFASGLGKGIIGVVAQPTGAIVDFASTSFDAMKRTATQEQIIRRVRYPRHVGRDGLVRPYIPHEAMGLYILNRLENGKYAKTDTYVAHISCLDSSSSWLMATSKRVLFVREVSFLGLYEIDWKMNYIDLQQIPLIVPEKQAIQILLKATTHRSSGKCVKYQNINDATYFIDKMTNAMHSIGL